MQPASLRCLRGRPIREREPARRRARSRSPKLETLEPRYLLASHVSEFALASARPPIASVRHPTAIFELHGQRVGAQSAPAKSKATTDTILHDFGGTIGNTPDGWQPWGSLTPVRTGSGTVIFGRTLFGGSSDDGTIFTIKPDGTDYTIVHSFAGGPNDGSQPHHDQLRQQGNILYGATLLGGQANQGVIFSLNTDGSGFNVIHSFLGGPDDGAQPHSNPMPDGPVLYGLTSMGGAQNEGTIYQINPDGSDFAVLYSFVTPTGTDPHGFVIVDHNNLYGMTREGGPSGDGAIFRYDLNKGEYHALHLFQGSPSDGATPDHGGLVRVHHTLYGVTTEGGQTNNGVVFAIDTSGKHFRLLHSFQGGPGDGAGPHGTLTLVGSTLYGMTSSGGTSNNGTIFAINTRGTHYRTVDNFNGPTSDGQDGLDNVFFRRGKLYGMTKFGGSIVSPVKISGDPTYANGVIFSLPLRHR
jgi:uncharacterized repeat protein (TIGR03803 family)